MDLSRLSKCKYIFKIYELSDNQIHVEKYPIVYANSTFVYFKVANKQSLGEVRTRNVFDDVSKVELNDTYAYRFSDIYIITDEDIDPRYFESFGRSFKQVVAKRAVKKQKDRVMNCKRMYEFEASRLAEMERKLEII